MLALLNRQMKTKPLRVALLGFGTVGASVARILCERPELADRLQLTHIFNRDVARKRADWVPSSVTWTEDADVHLRRRNPTWSSRSSAVSIRPAAGYGARSAGRCGGDGQQDAAGGARTRASEPGGHTRDADSGSRRRSPAVCR